MAIASHIIPKFYLDQFSTPSEKKKGSGLVWVYQKDKSPRHTSTRVQGAENGYFASVRPDGTLDESFEKRLEKLEEDCLDTLVLARSVLADLQSPSRRNALAFYSAMLFCRATQRRNRNQKSWVRIQKELGDLANDEAYIADLSIYYTKKHGKLMSTEKLRTSVAKAAKTMHSPTAFRNSFVKDLLGMVESLKETLLQQPWQVWRAPDRSEFVSSDNPLITFIEVGNGEFSLGHGFRKPGVVAVFPLAPCACLAMGVKGPESVTLDQDRLARVNEVIIRLCDRFVYSKTFPEKIQNSVDNVGGSAKYGEGAFLSVGLNIPTTKEYMRRVLRLE